MGKLIRLGKFVVMSIILTVAWFGLARQGAGQVPANLIQRTSGTLTSAVCEEPAPDCTVVKVSVQTSTTIETFLVTSLTSVYVGRSRSDGAALERFIGSATVVQFQTIDDLQIAGRIDILVFPAQATIGGGTPADGHEGVSGGASSGSKSGSKSGSSTAGGGTGGGTGGGGTGGGGTGGGGTGGGSTGGGSTGGGSTGGGSTGGGSTGGGSTGGGSTGGGSTGGGSDDTNAGNDHVGHSHHDHHHHERNQQDTESTPDR